MQILSIIAPCYNETESINSFYHEILSVFDSLDQIDFEIIFVDDGSCDGTFEKIKALADKDPRVLGVAFSRNFGKEAALTAGIIEAKGEAVIPIDVDLQDPASLIPKMIEEWKKGADVVLAQRTDRRTDSFLKRLTARGFYKLHNMFSDVKIPYDVGDFRLMDRKVVEALKLLGENQRFMKGLFAWLGFKTAIVNYRRAARTAGKTKFSGWKLWNFAIEGFTSFGFAPLKIWTYCGGLGAMLSLFYAVGIIIGKFIFDNPVPGYPSLFVAVTFLGSIQMVGIGILGEYIGRIYMESKRRPLYIIQKRYGDFSE